MGAGLNYLSQNGGNLSRDPYNHLNHSMRARIIEFLGKFPHASIALSDIKGGLNHESNNAVDDENPA